MGPVETWELIGRLVETLVLELEAHRLAVLKERMREIALRVTATTELEMVMPELIQLLGEDSKALKALKMVIIQRLASVFFGWTCCGRYRN